MSSRIYDFSDLIPKKHMKEYPPELFHYQEDYIDLACHYTTLHPDAQTRRARDVETIRELLKDAKLNFKRPEHNEGNPYFAIFDRSLDRMPNSLKRFWRGTRTAAANPEDEDEVVLDEPLSKDEAGWLVGLCALAPLVDPNAPDFAARDDDRADDSVCADTNPEIDPTGTKVWLVSGRRRQMERLVRGPCARVFSPVCPNAACVEAVADCSPLVLPFARGGYWAKMLRDAGADVEALDTAPYGSKPTADGAEPPLVKFSDVKCGEPEDVAAYPKRTLVLVWPRQCFGWAQEERETPADKACLQAFRGDRLIFVGNRSGTSSATLQFHDALNAGWKLQVGCGVPCWPGMEADLTIWTRKPANAE